MRKYSPIAACMAVRSLKRRCLERVLAALACVMFLVTAMPSHAQAIKTIEIHAKKYAFQPQEITLKKDEQVKLVLISDDVVHGLEVRGLGIRADMPVGQPVEVLVKPEQTGDFPGRCSRFCGTGHASMHFLVHVVQ